MLPILWIGIITDDFRASGKIPTFLYLFKIKPEILSRAEYELSFRFAIKTSTSASSVGRRTNNLDDREQVVLFVSSSSVSSK